VTDEQRENDLTRDPLGRLETKDKNLRALVAAFESLPVTAQLEYVSALILDRMERDDPMEPELTVAYDVLQYVKKTIDKVPNFDEMMPG